MFTNDVARAISGHPVSSQVPAYFTCVGQKNPVVSPQSFVGSISLTSGSVNMPSASSFSTVPPVPLYITVHFFSDDPTYHEPLDSPIHAPKLPF